MLAGGDENSQRPTKSPNFFMARRAEFNRDLLCLLQGNRAQDGRVQVFSVPAAVTGDPTGFCLLVDPLQPFDQEGTGMLRVLQTNNRPLVGNRFRIVTRD